MFRNHARQNCPVILMVKSHQDADYLKRLWDRLSKEDPSYSNLTELEQSCRLEFVPLGRGDVRYSMQKSAPLGCQQIHLYDREKSPETELRGAAGTDVNQYPHC